MARIQIIQFSCDIPECPTPGEGVQTRSVTKDREIDLCKTHSAEWDAAIAPFWANARKREVPTGRHEAKKTTGKRVTNADAVQERRNHRNQVKFWMADNGFTLPDRGRIPAECEAAYSKKDAGLLPEKYATPAVVQAPKATPEPEPVKASAQPELMERIKATAPKAPAKANGSKVPAQKTTTARKAPAKKATTPAKAAA